MGMLLFTLAVGHFESCPKNFNQKGSPVNSHCLDVSTNIFTSITTCKIKILMFGTMHSITWNLWDAGMWEIVTVKSKHCFRDIVSIRAI